MASDTLEKIDRARAAVAELNYGAREWKGLHEPASEDATDVVIMDALRCAALEIARLTRELEAARDRERHRERQRDAAEAEVQRLRRALQAVRECADLATARRISGEALYTTSEGDSRMDVETRRGLAAEDRRALVENTEGGYADPPAHPARMAQPDEEISL